jgi:hypothetical protein
MEERLTPELANELRSRLLEDADFARLFARYGLLNSCIRNEFLEEDLKESIERFVIPTSADAGTKPDLSDTDQVSTESIMKQEKPDVDKVHKIKARAEQQLHAFLAEQEELNRSQSSPPGASFDLYAACQAYAKKLDILLKRFVTIGVRTAVFGVFVLVMLAGIRYWLAHRVVATLDDSAHAVWRVPRQEPQLRRGSMTLEQGYAQLTFKQGTQVLIQAPCTFKLQSSNKMALENGSMTANVPSQAAGFRVQTPWTTVVDYGTEFGLSTGQTDGTEVHVFEGNVGVGDATSSQVATEGQAAHVDQAGRIGLKSLDDRPNLFVRHMPKTGSCFGIPGKRLDLADVVGGGNGFGTGVLGRALDPTKDYTTFTFRGTILRRPLNNSGQRAGSGFIGIEKLPFIDGIFVPNGSDQSTTVPGLSGHSRDIL